MIDTKFLIKVRDLMLPRPQLKDNVLDQTRAESLSELGIISLKCMDADYHDR